MKQLVEKLIALERQISTKKGEFSLFALFLREDAQDKWDLVAAAAWLEADKKKALDYLAQQLQSSLEPQELLSLSRIVLVDIDDPALQAVSRMTKGEHQITEVKDHNFFGLEIKDAYIITSKKHKELGDGVTFLT